MWPELWSITKRSSSMPSLGEGTAWPVQGGALIISMRAERFFAATASISKIPPNDILKKKEQDASLEVSLQKNYTLCAICGPPDIDFSNLLFPTYGRAVEGEVVRAMARLGVLEHNAIAVKRLARYDREKVIAFNV